ncbi:MAG: ribosome-associated protein [Kiritimatiellia bacterium]|jgi:ribosome-associated protein
MADDLPIPDGPTVPGHELSWSAHRSGGPGGQHVNTSSTAVRLKFALSRSVLHPAIKDRVRKAYGSYLNAEGDLLLVADTHRSQHRNLQASRDRLAKMLATCVRPPKQRRATRRTRGSVERRLTGKKQRSSTKKTRGKVRGD